MVSRTARMQPSGKGARLGVLLGLALALSLVCALPAAAGEGTVSLRVCTYNVLRFQGWPEDVAREQLGTAASRRLAHFTDVFGGPVRPLAIQGRLAVDRPPSREYGDGSSVLAVARRVPGRDLVAPSIVETSRGRWRSVRGEVPFSRTFGAAGRRGGRPILSQPARPSKPEDLRVEAHILADTLDELLRSHRRH